jgi:hypothetical protein
MLSASFVVHARAVSELACGEHISCGALVELARDVWSGLALRGGALGP